jgi:NADPH:quinone reductase-like Zn-dependent oxidoreductase
MSSLPEHSRHYQLAKQADSLQLRRADRPVIQPEPRQVLVQIGAASLNYRDLLTRQDANSNKDGLVPLSDGAGTVLAVGREVSRWRAGDRVSASFFAGWHDGRFSQSYLAGALGGGQTDGVLSQHIVADEAALVAVPDFMSLAEAATLPCAGVTAWHALFERGGLQAGDTVLVQGTGGVALFGLQLATAHGARVIVTSSSDDKLARARQLGAWKTINYRSQPAWDQAALDYTEGRGVDHILELGGPDTYDKSINAVASGGSIAQIGVLTGFTSQPNILPLQFKNASVHGICVGSVAHFERLSQFMASHQIHPVIDQQFGFDEAPLAYQQLQAAGHFGKLVIALH